MLAALADLQPKAAPDEPLTEPVFSKATSTGRGMLAHVERVHDSFLNVRRDLLELRARANARQNQAKSLIDRVCDFLDDYLKPEELRRLGVIDDEAQARPFRLLVAPDLHNAEGVLLRPDSTSPFPARARTTSKASSTTTNRRSSMPVRSLPTTSARSRRCAAP